MSKLFNQHQTGEVDLFYLCEATLADTIKLDLLKLNSVYYLIMYRLQINYLLKTTCAILYKIRDIMGRCERLVL